MLNVERKSGRGYSFLEYSSTKKDELTLRSPLQSPLWWKIEEGTFTSEADGIVGNDIPIRTDMLSVM